MTGRRNGGSREKERLGGVSLGKKERVRGRTGGVKGNDEREVAGGVEGVGEKEKRNKYMYIHICHTDDPFPHPVRCARTPELGNFKGCRIRVGCVGV